METAPSKVPGRKLRLCPQSLGFALRSAYWVTGHPGFLHPIF